MEKVGWGRQPGLKTCIICISDGCAPLPSGNGEFVISPVSQYFSLLTPSCISSRHGSPLALMPAVASYYIAAHLLDKYPVGFDSAELPDAFLFNNLLTMGEKVLELVFA